MRHKTRTWLLVSMGMLLALVFFNGAVTYRRLEQVRAGSERVIQAQDVLNALEQIVSVTNDAEAGQRGYLLTGQEEYLTPYTLARSQYRNRLERIAKLTGDNPKQRGRVLRLRELVEARLDLLEKTVSMRRGGDYFAPWQILTSDDGRRFMEETRALANEMETEERMLLARRMSEDHNAYRSAVLNIFLGSGYSIVALAAFFVLLRRYLSALDRSASTIRQQRELLRATLSSIDDAVIATDIDRRVTFLNARAESLTGWRQEDARGQPLDKVFRIMDETSRTRIEDPGVRVLRDGVVVTPTDRTVLVSRTDGECPIDDSAAPIMTETGEVTGVILVFRDVGERRRQEVELRRQAEALQEADRRKDEFLATLAHELRNPLSPISNALQLWPTVEQKPAEMERLRGVMERQVHQMTRLIDDLMDVSRITRGKIQLRSQPVELSTLVAGAIEAVRPMVDLRRHQLTVELSKEPVWVNGDVARLTQVFANILHNAAKYTGKGGTIHVEAIRHEGRAVVRIGDNGPGIPPQMLSAIFDAFRQVDETLDRAHGGLGIGLTLVKQLVELHGGSVEARSGGAEQGSEFIVELPAIDVAASDRPHGSEYSDSEYSDEEAADRVGTPVNGASAHRVLVVDDVEASAKTLAMMLHAIGHDAATLTDPTEVTDYIEVHRPDTVFLDIAMPGMNGYDVARSVRGRPHLADVVLVALTGYGQEEDRRRAFEAGFNFHLCKPASLETLENLLATVPAGRAGGSG
jgi:PAS domain S-box-containing protein